MNIKKDIKIALLSSIGMTVATVASAAAPTHTLPAMPAVAPAAAWFVGAEALYWRPENGNLQYAVVDHNTDSDNHTMGTLMELDPSWDWGFRVMAGYCFNDKTSLVVSYTNFNASETEASDEPTNSEQWAILVHPDGNPKADHATASFKVDLDEVDVTVNRKVDLGKWHVQFGGGLRYLPNLDSKFTVNYENDGRDKYTLITKKSDFSGIGPRASASGVYNFVDNLGIVVETGCSLLIGKVKASETQVRDESSNPSGGAVDVTKERSDHNIVPELDVKLGLRYVYKWGENYGIALDGGWQAVKYFDARHQMLFDGGWDDNSTPAFHNRTKMQISNIGFDGPYVGLRAIIS